jgi:hypothetical protein
MSKVTSAHQHLFQECAAVSSPSELATRKIFGSFVFTHRSVTLHLVYRYLNKSINAAHSSNTKTTEVTDQSPSDLQT